MLQWSMVRVDGALASFKPQKKLPPHRFTANGGLSELCRDVGGPNVKKFFVGWMSFIKMAIRQKGTLSFLGNVAKLPVAIYTNGPDLTVGTVPVGDELCFDSILAVAVLRASTNAFDMKAKITTRMFQQTGEKLGAAFALDGGGGDATETAQVSLRSSMVSARFSSSDVSQSIAPTSSPTSTPTSSPTRSSSGLPNRFARFT